MFSLFEESHNICKACILHKTLLLHAERKIHSRQVLAYSSGAANTPHSATCSEFLHVKNIYIYKSVFIPKYLSIFAAINIFSFKKLCNAGKISLLFIKLAIFVVKHKQIVFQI